jgi:hypothetical protein
MRELSTAALCAKAIREEMKKEYPGQKFTVQCSNFSVGNSVHVRWRGGPWVEDVHKILEKYRAGHFDGMSDCTERELVKKAYPEGGHTTEYYLKEALKVKNKDH